MLDSCTYDKVKLLHELSCIAWFIKHHGLEDTKNAGDQQAHDLFAALEQDLERYIEELKKSF